MYFKFTSLFTFHSDLIDTSFQNIFKNEGELGYPEGKMEIPPGETFNLEIEVLKNV